jgi:hypothetical protein
VVATLFQPAGIARRAVDRRSSLPSGPRREKRRGLSPAALRAARPEPGE